MFRFMANGSLKDICTRDSPTYRGHIALDAKIRFAHQAAKGVLNLHSRNIIHRDLACRNLLLDDKMDVFVADFGFARRKQVANSKGFTLTGLGPVRWEAPESLKSKAYSEKTDAFSFGVCLYEIMTGKAPWDHVPSIAMVATNVISGDRMLLPISCDCVIASLIKSCWSHKPQDRPDFSTIVTCLGNRHQEVTEMSRELRKEVNTIEFILRGTNIMKFPFGAGTEHVSRPKHRFIRVTSDLNQVVWSSSNSNSIFKTSAVEKGIEVDSIIEVRIGQTTPAFQRSSITNIVMPSNASFSIITDTRTVDIVCESSQHRDMWVWGITFLRRRKLPSKKYADIMESLYNNFGSPLPHSRAEAVRISNELTIGKGDYNLLKERFYTLESRVSTLREVACYLQRGEIMLKFTTRKTHARHVFLSPDLNEIMWNVEEDVTSMGSNRFDKARSISVGDIDHLIIGKQPKMLVGSSRVASAASHLSESLKFNKGNQLQKNQLSKISTQNEVDPVKSAQSQTSFKKRRGSIHSISSYGDSIFESFTNMQPPSLKREKSGPKDEDHGSDDEDVKSSVDDNVDTQNKDDEGDYQLCVSYVGIDGRTLLALKCPNSDVLDLWTEGLMTLAEGLRSYRYQDTRHSYQSGNDILAHFEEDKYDNKLVDNRLNKSEIESKNGDGRRLSHLWQADLEVEGDGKYSVMPEG